ncbi:MAG TPA: hypothetical protein VGI28_08120 [Stellaceae bacterium]
MAGEFVARYGPKEAVSEVFDQIEIALVIGDLEDIPDWIKIRRALVLHL